MTATEDETDRSRAAPFDQAIAVSIDWRHVVTTYGCGGRAGDEDGRVGNTTLDRTLLLQGYKVGRRFVPANEAYTMNVGFTLCPR